MNIVQQLEELTLNKAVKIITKSLKNQGRYSSDLEQLIVKAAGDLLAYCKCLMDLDKLEHCYYEVLGRDGRMEYKRHPIFDQMPILSRALERSLSALDLTVASVSVDDPLVSMLESLQGAKD